PARRSGLPGERLPRPADRAPAGGHPLSGSTGRWGPGHARSGAGGKDPTGRLLETRQARRAPRGSLLVLVDLQQLGRLRPETAKFHIVWLVFVHPLDGFVVPPVGLFLVAQLPVRHGQQESLAAVSA